MFKIKKNNSPTSNKSIYTCICTRSSVLIHLEASLSLPSPRVPHKESISSTKMMDGALSRAIWKRFETSFSLSPIHFETRSDEEILNGPKRCYRLEPRISGKRQKMPFLLACNHTHSIQKMPSYWPRIIQTIYRFKMDQDLHGNTKEQ